MWIPDSVHIHSHSFHKTIYDAVVKRCVQWRTSTGRMQDLKPISKGKKDFTTSTCTIMCMCSYDLHWTESLQTLTKSKQHFLEFVQCRQFLYRVCPQHVFIIHLLNFYVKVPVDFLFQLPCLPYVPFLCRLLWRERRLHRIFHLGKIHTNGLKTRQW